MKITIGKQLDGPVNYIPEFILWGGCLFINAFKRSVMISLPQVVLDFLVMVGVDPYDG